VESFRITDHDLGYIEILLQIFTEFKISHKFTQIKGLHISIFDPGADPTWGGVLELPYPYEVVEHPCNPSLIFVL